MILQKKINQAFIIFNNLTNIELSKNAAGALFVFERNKISRTIKFGDKFPSSQF
jgi:hypothetical protein